MGLLGAGGGKLPILDGEQDLPIEFADQCVAQGARVGNGLGLQRGDRPIGIMQ